MTKPPSAPASAKRRKPAKPKITMRTVARLVLAIPEEKADRELQPACREAFDKVREYCKFITRFSISPYPRVYTAYTPADLPS